MIAHKYLLCHNSKKWNLIDESWIFQNTNQ